jgi:queuosine precursor transporter
MTKVANPFVKFGNWCKDTGKWLVDIKDWKALFRSVPSVVVALLVLATVMMNIGANKIILSSQFVAADGGFLLSWIPFICMDITTRRYGPKAATKLTIFALLVNLLMVGIFAGISALHIGIGNVDVVNPADPAYGTWDKYWESFASFDATFSCTWFVLLSSSIAFLASGIINNVLNWAVGLCFKKHPDSKVAFFTRSYVSTGVGQFVDNLLFATLLYMVFAPIYWGYSLTIFQCLGSALMGAILELLMEVIFSPIGLRVYRKWEEDGVGLDYLKSIENKENN